MTLKASWIMLLVFSLSLPALGQTRDATPSAPQTQSLSLDRAIRIALKTHPALKQAAAAVAAAEARVDEARAAYYPQISFSGIDKMGLSGATSALDLPGFPASPFFRNTAYSVNWLQSVFDFGRIKHYVALERALSTSAQLNEAEEQQKIVFDVKRAYLSVLEAQELERLGEETLKERNLIFERAQVYAQAAIGPELDVRLAQARQAEAQGNLTHAKNAVATAFAALRAAMGLNGPQVYRLMAPELHVVSPPPLEDLVQEGFRNRPDEMALESRIAAASENVRLTRGQSLPTINAFAAGGQGRFNGTPVKQNQRHGVCALGVMLPIFTGGRLKAQRREAKAGLEGAIAAREELQQQIRLQVSDAYYQILDLSERIHAAAEQQKAAEAALALAQARSREQLGSFLEVLTAEVAATRASTNNARTQTEYQLATAELAFATGQTVHP